MKKSYSGHVKEGMYSRRGKVNEEGKGGWMCLMYLLHICGYWTLKPVDAILSRQREGMNKMRVHCTYM
jgi:hypothetical protein